jgi:protein tyrosine phosphatase (PTP) superfamily phosphohydrolase (DUF442 family)
VVVLGGLSSLVGCQHCGSCSMCPPGSRVPIQAGPVVGGPSFAPPPLPPPPLRGPGCAPPQVGRFGPTPQPPFTIPPSAQPYPQLPTQPQVPPRFPQPEPQIRLQAPEPGSPPETPPSVPRLYGPEPGPYQPSPGAPPIPEPSPPTPPRKPDTVPDRPLVPPLPVGIPGFAEVRKGVSSGLRPNSLDGLDWLAASGYRTALHLREPGQDDAGDRKQFESRGLRYISLEVSPDNLTPEVVDRFNRTVADLAGQPLFVYDRDGMLVGGLWYLHFRLVEGFPDEEALTRAGRLGLKTDPAGGHQRMLLAVQKYLSQHPR